MKHIRLTVDMDALDRIWQIEKGTWLKTNSRYNTNNWNMKYWQKVKITSWFYEGMEWTLKREFNTWMQCVTIDNKIDFINTYLVQLNDIELWTLIDFPESSLEIIK